jgi:hypothetical protein
MGSAALPQLPHPRVVLSFWWIQCVAESRTTAVFFSVHPPAFVHSHVVSLGCTSGVVPGVWAIARPRRVDAMSAYEVIVKKDKICSFFACPRMQAAPHFIQFQRCLPSLARYLVSASAFAPQYGYSGTRRAAVHISVVDMGHVVLRRPVSITPLAVMFASTPYLGCRCFASSLAGLHLPRLDRKNMCRMFSHLGCDNPI